MRFNVGLFGFGKTGLLVAQELAKDSDFNLKWVMKKNVNPNTLYASHSLGYTEKFAPFVSVDMFCENFLKANPVDIVIDFSVGGSTKLYSILAARGVKVVSAISNYSAQEIELIKIASQQTAVLASPNITLGINWLLIASKLLKQIIPNADVEIVEEHFRNKKEVSGTALKIAEHLDLDEKNHVNSIRVGGIVGKHEVIFGLPYQTLRLTHESVSRSAFGTGAIFAAKWLMEKQSGLYKMENVFQEKFLTHIQNLGL
ncbi:4-hydroxy-tetrahydrodipicolinate reductase [Pseudobdellovibrio sp. HCB154]|uniref:4-hydroxy-tetrahydrodipicolinate reductase n=1 Tax=Pseudobdellovibrio sp. HCB154 TaxID=3386277 RepID=UPI003916E7B5